MKFIQSIQGLSIRIINLRKDPMKKLLVICSLLLSTTAFAGGIERFTQERFNQLQEDNASVLIDIKASWCPTCKKQGKVISKFLKQNPDSDLTVLSVDYDAQKKWVRHFKAFRQSTLIKFQGDTEVGRVIAETNEKKLFSFFTKKDA